MLSSRSWRSCRTSRRARGFTVPGLGKLVLVDRKARMGRNPATGEQIQIPAKRVLKFRIGKQAKDAILARAGPRGPGKPPKQR